MHFLLLLKTAAEIWSNVVEISTPQLTPCMDSKITEKMINYFLIDLFSGISFSLKRFMSDDKCFKNFDLVVPP